MLQRCRMYPGLSLTQKNKTGIKLFHLTWIQKFSFLYPEVMSNRLFTGFLDVYLPKCIWRIPLGKKYDYLNRYFL